MTAREITAAVMLAAGTVSVMAAGSVLSPDEIKATFATGAPFTAVSTSGGKPYWFTFKADGSALQIPKGQSKGTAGTWRLSDKGYCTRWGANKEHCYTVDKSGSQYEVRNSAGSPVSSWTPATLTAAPTARSAAPVLAKAAYADGTYAGPVENAYYGLVQIQAIVQGGRLVGIKVLQYPSDRSTSIAINRHALPMLRDEVVSAQSARVDIVSGATLTSEAFIRSLGTALKQAKS